MAKERPAMTDAPRLTDEFVDELIKRDWPLTAPERRSLLAELQSLRAQQSEGARAKVVEDNGRSPQEQIAGVAGEEQARERSERATSPSSPTHPLREVGA